MKKIILVPEAFMSEDVVSDRWRLLIRMLRDRLGFEIVMRRREIPDDIGIAMIIGTPRYLAAGFPFLENNGAKLIVYTADIHKATDFRHADGMHGLFERCDIHLSAGNKLFTDYWPEYAGKHVYFPYFFASQERYESLPFNENPVMKCLFTGHIAKVYELRRTVYCFVKTRVAGTEMFDILEHPGNLNAREESAIVGDDYASFINRYFCGITSTLHGYPLAKHFEIMAAGSLLLTNKSEDLATLGMKPGRHYIPVTLENYREKVKECLGNPEKYENIRKRGMEFSRKNHGIESRLKQLEGILEQL